MPTVMDAKAISLNMLKVSYRLMSKDLEFLPHEVFDRKFGTACRTVADIIYEVNLVNDHVRLTISGEELFAWPEGWIFAPEDKRTKETVIASFTHSMERFIATVEGFSDDEMLSSLPSDDGETNRFERCRFVAQHNWYHSGQLNFIQTLLGDDAFHW
ncbi:MAG: DinB family protein [Chthonomonadales bacterium]